MQIARQISNLEQILPGTQRGDQRVVERKQADHTGQGGRGEDQRFMAIFLLLAAQFHACFSLSFRRPSIRKQAAIPATIIKTSTDAAEPEPIS
ncbi:hypothetical protein D3C71_1802500 [compost metagenome]